MLLIMPWYYGFKIVSNSSKLDRPEIIDKYGFVYEDLKVSSAAKALGNLIFMLRRAIFSTLVIFCEPYPALQIIFHV